MKRRYAYKLSDNWKQIKINEDFFKGYACFLKIQNIEKPLIVYNGKENVCIKDNDYEWIEVYPNNGKYAFTIMFDDKGNLIEWYFDIAKKIGIKNGIPYEDDLYLDMVITPEGEEFLLDEDELIDALNKGDITKEDIDEAYKSLKHLEEKYASNYDYLLELTNYLYGMFKENRQYKE